MKIFLVLALIIVAIIVAILFFGREKFAGFGASIRVGTNQVVLFGTDEPENLATPTTNQASSALATSAQQQKTNAAANLAKLVTSNPQPATPPPLTVLDNCRVLIHNYAARFGENPVGNNAEITAALRGNNPKQVDFFREDSGLRVNEKGELVDAYDTSFFFHQVSAQVMEIRSAGEDKKFWTFDDQVTR